MSQRPHILTVLGLLAALVAAGAADSQCADGGQCAAETGDDLSLLHLQKPMPIVKVVYPTCGSKRGANYGTHFGIPYDAQCSKDTCCSQYGRTFPCPSSTPGYPYCMYGEIQGDDTLPDPKAPSTRKPVFDSNVWPQPWTKGNEPYTGVKLPGGQTLEANILAEPGVASVTVCSSTKPNACYATAFDNLETRGLQYLWGDLGASMQPGFGGIRTYNAVSVTPKSAAEPLVLYHMDVWNPTAPADMCNIWWGDAKTYEKQTLLQASINVQTEWDYTALVRCEFSEKFETVVGQGWDENGKGYQWRGVIDDDWKPTDGYNGNPSSKFVGPLLLNEHLPGAPQDLLQWVQPSCSIAAKCTACPITEKTRLVDVALPFRNPKTFRKFGCVDIPKVALDSPQGQLPESPSLAKMHR
jgi:hypothetical protein